VGAGSKVRKIMSQFSFSGSEVDCSDGADTWVDLLIGSGLGTDLEIGFGFRTNSVAGSVSVSLWAEKMSSIWTGQRDGWWKLYWFGGVGDDSVHNLRGTDGLWRATLFQIKQFVRLVALNLYHNDML